MSTPPSDPPPPAAQPPDPAQGAVVFDAPFSDRSQWAAGASSAYPAGGRNTGDNKLDHLVPGYGPDGDRFTALRENGRSWRTPLVTTEGTAGGFELRPGDRLEARCQVTADQGVWPAIWTWGRDVAPGQPQPGHGEVDVLEYHDDHPRQLELSNHVRPGDPAYLDGLVTPGRWFTVACVFGADSVRWELDGREVYADGRGVGPDWRAWIIVNLSVAGGRWGHRQPRANARRLSWRCRDLTVRRPR
ncbi:glycoside hydrolase family 16 protein [Kitasatospora phosalacinea]|uniref:glycoside hydrolase family 16 protein n=1 Tax=Kitasatospora phosalacinea TaxID=2065 RepID=UPI000A3EDACE|nr:family 16 glycosylhydrolase [Kitasatospora phosalacinea]